jgi:hypothetical protein
MENDRLQRLSGAIQDKYPGRWPLTYAGAQLFGPASNADPAADMVLLGFGVAVLLDPADDGGRVGEYSLLFFGEDEGASQAVRTFPIGPRMSLKHAAPDEHEDDGPAVTFDLNLGRNLPAHSLAFDEAAVAAAFSRDFRVRSRLMDISLKTAKGQNAVSEANEELRELRSKSLGARLWRTFCLLMLLLVVAIVGRVGMLYSQTPGKAPEIYMQQVQKDLKHAVHISQTFVSTAGAEVCKLVAGTVSSADLKACLEVGGVSQVRECVSELVPTAAR